MEDEEEEVEHKPRVKSKIMEVSLEMVELLSMIMARKIEIEEEGAAAPERRRTWSPSLHFLIHRLHPGPKSTDVNSHLHTHCILHSFPSGCIRILIFMFTIVINAVINNEIPVEFSSSFFRLCSGNFLSSSVTGEV